MKKRVKALFQIAIIIFSIFTVSLLAEPVSASKVCCEKTKDGRSCVNTEQSNCDPSGSINQISCEQTSFCQLGCCFDFKENIFNKNVPLATCTESQEQNPNLQFNLGDFDCGQALADYPRGCCVLANECSYTTSDNCKKLGFEHGTEAEFQDAVSEVDCVMQCRQQEEGCCITEGGCSYTTRANCVSSEDSLSQFNLNQYCSSFDSCFCKQKDHKECYDGNVYWFDSCGNKEELVKECSYDKGLKCGEVNGQIDCKSLNCKVTPDENNPLDFFPNGIAKNGESWCLYDSQPGPSLDLVGSRHYRVVCVEGDEIVEPCRDFREEICVQADIETSDGVFRESSCIKNRNEDCTTECNKAEPPKPGIENEDEYNRELARYKSELAKDKECCENRDLRSCFWAGEEDSGVCLPLVPPGSKFWEPGSENNCDNADKECITVWYDPGYYKDPKIVSGEQCETQEFLQSSNAYCRAQGDCGAHYNYKGKYTQDGFSFKYAYNKWANFKQTPYPDELTQPSFSEFAIARDGLYLGKINAGDLIQGASVGLSAFFNNFPGGKIIAISAVGVTYIGLATLGGGLGAAGIGLTGLVNTALGSAKVGTLETLFGFKLGALAQPLAIISLAAIAVIAFFFIQSLGAERQDLTHTTTCDLWQAPSGGQDCSLCDKDPLKPCSEYRCKSLGQLCTFISENEGTNRPTCVNQNPNDVNSPIIIPWPENLTKPYQLKTQSSGFEITPAIKPFQEITIGIKTNEPAQCKIDKEIKDYDVMLNFFGNQYYEKEHSITLNLDSGQDITYYVKCQDNAGNKNTVPYQIKLQTQKGPDLTPPVIEGSDLTNIYIPAHLSTKSVSIFINEPVECKYSNVNEDITQMQNSMSCYYSANNLFMSKYKCTANLPIQKGENNYYFKCKDNNGNTNSDPFSINLIGTDPLNITETEPTGELFYSDVTLKVITEGGAEQGKASCSYNSITFLNTNSSQHTQQLNLTKNNYNFNIFCEDIAGNTAEDKISFTVTRDETFSEVYHIYKDPSSIYVVLDEPTTCKYSEEEFEYEDGIEMTGQDKEHSMSLGLEQYYVVCKDVFGNFMPTIKIYP